MASNNMNPRKRVSSNTFEYNSKRSLPSSRTNTPTTNSTKTECIPKATVQPTPSSSNDVDLPTITYLPDKVFNKNFQQTTLLELSKLKPSTSSSITYDNDDIMNKELDVLLNMELVKRKCKDEELEKMLKKLAFMRATLNYLLINSDFDKMEFSLHNSYSNILHDYNACVRKPDSTLEYDSDSD